MEISQAGGRSTDHRDGNALDPSFAFAILGRKKSHSPRLRRSGHVGMNEWIDGKGRSEKARLLPNRRLAGQADCIKLLANNFCAWQLDRKTARPPFHLLSRRLTRQLDGCQDRKRERKR